ncbi:YgaP family membrane protein [Desulforamulus ruminis]|uniref:Inner membrane protein YgaP-like transmembrane domain-containing protein n=1 Tax=Desulforamulus ruminis (strain ATCC 23193 / DSM 2154 / NCIMB 8452 / DL) TaxID=696281 RepID=F6DSV3_DESRL|nr:DUF2892 domain-containing protein [Desulforamulus ruminis]AEG59947.1 hypothetical protein Desru_1683 [Desulforamulus ruminis DSM 2154]
MQKNVGTADRIFRFPFGLAFVAIGLLKHFSPTWSILFGLLGFEVLLVALTGYSPLYALLDISSLEAKQFVKKVVPTKWITWDRDSEK